MFACYTSYTYNVYTILLYNMIYYTIRPAPGGARRRRRGPGAPGGREAHQGPNNTNNNNTDTNISKTNNSSNSNSSNSNIDNTNSIVNSTNTSANYRREAHQGPTGGE